MALDSDSLFSRRDCCEIFVSHADSSGLLCFLGMMHVETFFLMSLLITCVYCRALGSRRSGWRPGHKKHRLNPEVAGVGAWDQPGRKRDQHPQHASFVDECCPSVTEIVQPLGGVSKGGRIFELYRDANSTQSFYQTSCREGVKGRPCRYLARDRKSKSMCVQRYSYTYALVREFDSNVQWRLDYIRIRSGCSCEIKVEEWYGRKRKRPSGKVTAV